MRTEYIKTFANSIRDSIGGTCVTAFPLVNQDTKNIHIKYSISNGFGKNTETIRSKILSLLHLPESLRERVYLEELPYPVTIEDCAEYPCNIVNFNFAESPTTETTPGIEYPFVQSQSSHSAESNNYLVNKMDIFFDNESLANQRNFELNIHRSLGTFWGLNNFLYSPHNPLHQSAVAPVSAADAREGFESTIMTPEFFAEDLELAGPTNLDREIVAKQYERAALFAQTSHNLLKFLNKYITDPDSTIFLPEDLAEIERLDLLTEDSTGEETDKIEEFKKLHPINPQHRMDVNELYTTINSRPIIEPVAAEEDLHTPPTPFNLDFLLKVGKNLTPKPIAPPPTNNNHLMDNVSAAAFTAGAVLLTALWFCKRKKPTTTMEVNNEPLRY